MRKLTVLFQQAPGAPAAAGYYVAWEAGVLQYKATADADATALFAPDGGQVLCMRASDGALYCQGRQVGGLQGQGLLTARYFDQDLTLEVADLGQRCMHVRVLAQGRQVALVDVKAPVEAVIYAQEAPLLPLLCLLCAQFLQRDARFAQGAARPRQEHLHQDQAWIARFDALEDAAPARQASPPRNRSKGRLGWIIGGVSAGVLVLIVGVILCFTSLFSSVQNAASDVEKFLNNANVPRFTDVVGKRTVRNVSVNTTNGVVTTTREYGTNTPEEDAEAYRAALQDVGFVLHDRARDGYVLRYDAARTVDVAIYFQAGMVRIDTTVYTRAQKDNRRQMPAV